MPFWVEKFELHLDNAGINKSRFIISGLAYLVAIGRFTEVVIIYLIAGHAKVSSDVFNCQFHPDKEFSRIANRYYSRDVYGLTDLQQIIEESGFFKFFSSDEIWNYKTTVGEVFQGNQSVKRNQYFKITSSNQSWQPFRFQSLIDFLEKQFKNTSLIPIRCHTLSNSMWRHQLHQRLPPGFMTSIHHRM